MFFFLLLLSSSQSSLLCLLLTFRDFFNTIDLESIFVLLISLNRQHPLVSVFRLPLLLLLWNVLPEKLFKYCLDSTLCYFPFSQWAWLRSQHRLHVQRLKYIYIVPSTDISTVSCPARRWLELWSAGYEAINTCKNKIGSFAFVRPLRWTEDGTGVWKCDRRSPK